MREAESVIEQPERARVGSDLEPFARDAHGKPFVTLDAASIYQFGSLIRATERTLLELFTQGALSGTTHTCLGQELCQMAVVRALTDPNDAIVSNHRNHGHFLTYSGDFKGLLAEVMGRSGGVCGGVGGSQHLAFRNFHSNGVQAGMTANAVGQALSRKKRGESGVVAIIVGDGTLGEGLLYEVLISHRSGNCQLCLSWRITRSRKPRRPSTRLGAASGAAGKPSD